MVDEVLRTAVFVDYESWFWGLYNKYGERPDLEKFLKEIEKRGQIEIIEVFGDFTKEEIKPEKDRLAFLTNYIIDCSSEKPSKQYTDFIMLDHIYRRLIDGILNNYEIDQYVIVSGDSHYLNVARLLKRTFRKKLGVLAVKGTLSETLAKIADWVVEIEPEHDMRDELIPYVLETLQVAERKKEIWPVFSGTVRACSQYNKLDPRKVGAALSKLIQDGYIKQEERTTDNGIQIKVLVPDWDLIRRYGLMN